MRETRNRSRDDFRPRFAKLTCRRTWRAKHERLDLVTKLADDESQALRRSPGLGTVVHEQDSKTAEHLPSMGPRRKEPLTDARSR